MPRIYIPDNFQAPVPPLPLEVKRFSLRADIDVDEQAEALALRLLPAERISYLASRMPNLRWLQLLVAGVDQALQANLPPQVIISNGRGIHDAPTAEMALALLLSAVRGMHRWRDDQKKHIWDSHAYSRHLFPDGPFLGTLEGARVLILGMGSIGLEIARRLVPFGAKIEGVAQSAGEREGFPVHATSHVLTILERFDAVIAVLPETRETHGFINEAFLKHMAKHAWFVNVGRGTAVNEPALIKALRENWIAGAALDVTAQEPLPPDSPLWDLPNLILAPHVGGGGPRFYEKAGKLIQENAKRYLAGEPLLNVIDRARGY